MFLLPHETVEGKENGANKKKKSKNEKYVSLISSEPKRTHKPAVRVLLIKMRSVLSSLSFLFLLFLPNPGCMGPSPSFLSQHPTLLPCVAADDKHMASFLDSVARRNSQHRQIKCIIYIFHQYET